MYAAVWHLVAQILYCVGAVLVLLSMIFSQIQLCCRRERASTIRTLSGILLFSCKTTSQFAFVSSDRLACLSVCWAQTTAVNCAKTVELVQIRVVHGLGWPMGWVGNKSRNFVFSRLGWVVGPQVHLPVVGLGWLSYSVGSVGLGLGR